MEKRTDRLHPRKGGGAAFHSVVSIMSILFGLTLVFIFPVVLNAQSIVGPTQICPGSSYTYSFNTGEFCTSTGDMTCVGCSVAEATPYFITLTWLPGEPFYSVTVPTRCNEPDIIPPQTIDDFLTLPVVPQNTTVSSFICANTPTSTFLATNRNVPDNDSRCSHPTLLIVSFAHDPDPNFLTKGYPFNRNLGDNSTGYHTQLTTGNFFQFTAFWQPGWEGSVTITLQFERLTNSANPFSSCDKRIEDITTFTWTRSGQSPGGALTGPDAVTIGGAFDLTYQKRSDYPANVQGIQYFLDGTQIAQISGCGGSGLNLHYQTQSSGTLTFTTKQLDQCGVWSDGPSKTVNVFPSCYQDNPTNITTSIAGPGLQSFPEGFLVEKDVSYDVLTGGITDLSTNYAINFGAGQSDMSVSGSFFSIHKSIGRYQIGFDKLPGREVCPDIPGITVFIGGKDETLTKTCTITLPDDFAELGFPGIIPGDIVLNYFAAKVISKRGIIVKPGITLAMGAELILQLDPAAPPPNDTDVVINFIQTTSYDEYNRVLSQKRNYFDQRGRATQSQFKNLSAGVMMANATLYDSYARQAINTLPAPVEAVILTTDGCTGQQQVGEDIHFQYKPDFVQADDGQSYGARHFDINNGAIVENSPVPLSDQTPGTLGWYYSVKNGGALGDLAKINEPLTAATHFPYVRMLFHRDGSGDKKGNTRPGDGFRAGAGHNAFGDTGPVTPGDVYIAAYLSMREQALGLPSPGSTDGQFFIASNVDENGKKSTAYTDKAGNTIIGVYFGSQSTPITRTYRFYDNAGRLLATVSPNGIAQYNGSNFGQIDKSRYFYNHKGWVLAVEETDRGRTEYVYRKDGKIRFSQNAEQRKTGRYSYSHFDRSGRPVESGEYQPTGIAFKSASMNAILENTQAGGGLPANQGTYNNRMYTYYDLTFASSGLDPADEGVTALTNALRTQRFVHGAVSLTRKDDYVMSVYSYNDQGRVEWLLQWIKGAGVKTLDYRYGPTGAIQEVVYQKDIDAERFTHYYEYDADGRLFKTSTTTGVLQFTKAGTLSNPEVLQLQATYFYYLQGPVKRIEYAGNIQGIDYVYTADGALKGINHFDPARDPNHDGSNNFRADVFGMTLDYFSGDYLSNLSTENATTSSPDQFGGLIKAMRWHGPVESDSKWGYAFTYDDRYQFSDARWGEAIGDIFTPNPVNSYFESVGGYDGNGNITSLNRKNELGSDIADFGYQYASNTNKLTSITNNNTTFRSYQYNALGQMTEQAEASGKKFKTSYDVTGKVTEIRDETDKLVTTYVYDDRGFRMKKITPVSSTENLETLYVRDAIGGLVATYEKDAVTEFPVYASGRIGEYKPGPGFKTTFYEVADHLGNVRAVIGGGFTHDYLATLEDEWAVNETDFKDLKPVPVASFINHTSATVTLNGASTAIANPSKVMRINNGMDMPKDPIGGGIFLWVHPGDKISAEVFAKYANFDGTNTNTIAGMAGYLASSFGGSQTVIDGVNIFAGIDQTPTGVYSVLSNVDDNLPKAFLTYVYFDKNMVPLAFDFDQVTTAAQIPMTSPELHIHERLQVGTINIKKEGYIYVYVSNQSDQNMDVYFDDLKVTHVYSDIVAGGDYYPFGMEISDRQITREEYRFGYQGQSAEKDKETGWNHFELRGYDALIGRWLVPDPMGQYWSPYVAMGNNPVNLIDRTGGLTDPKDGQLNDAGTHTWDARTKSWVKTLDPIIVTAKPDFDTHFVLIAQDATARIALPAIPLHASVSSGETRGRGFNLIGGHGSGNAGENAFGTKMISDGSYDVDPLLEIFGIDKGTAGSGEDLLDILNTRHKVDSMIHSPVVSPFDTIWSGNSYMYFAEPGLQNAGSVRRDGRILYTNGKLGKTRSFFVTGGIEGLR